MSQISTTQMSSKGQVVIPEKIRIALNLREGSQFIVMGENDVVILKTLVAPSMEDFDSLIRQTRAQAKKAKLKKSDIKAAIAKARAKE